jgi:hypothetical protein
LEDFGARLADMLRRISERVKLYPRVTVTLLNHRADGHGTGTPTRLVLP